MRRRRSIRLSVGASKGRKMAGLELSNVKKSFGSVDVIHGVDLTVDDGEFTVFVGPSGCGKSTLLRLVAGLEQATGGNLAIGDKDVTDTEPADRGVAMVFQSYALYPHMTVEENMGFGLKMTGHPEARSRPVSTRAAEILQLEPLLTQAQAAFRRPAPARGHRPRHRAATRDRSCSTSRCPISMPNCGCRCGLRSPSCTRSSAPP
jgi:ABC-type Fe3+/spermidine/putrescine transport system ATPase subunit